jgi:DNA-binding response OmpR family regulator
MKGLATERLHTSIVTGARPSERGLGAAARVPLVLLVEPHEDSREMMRVLFETGGLTVAEYYEGERMVDEIARLHPDLIIVEERLPHLDGRAACHRLRHAAEDIRHTPVIFTSSSSEASSAHLAFEAGCTLYFIKPFDIEELIAAATELVTRGQAPAPAALPVAALGLDTSRTTSPAARSDTRRAISACDTMPKQTPCASTTGIRRI